MRNKDNVLYRIRHDLILNHMSKKIIKEGITACSHIVDDMREEFLSSVIGSTKDNSDINVDHSNTIRHIDTKAVMNMSDEERMDLYNKIIKSVNLNESK